MKSLKQKKYKRILILLLASLLVLGIAGIVLFYAAYIPKRYEQFVSKYAQENKIEENLIYAIIRAESSFNENAVSSSGAVGLMQLMPSTAQFICKCLGEDLDVYSANDNIRMGVWYLGYLGKKFSGQDEQLAAYNAGEGNVRRWLQDASFSSDGIALQKIPFPETEKYVRRVKKFYKYYNFFYD